MGKKTKRGIYESFVKRALDAVFALILLFVLFPVFLILAISVRIKLGSPVIFKQPRGGINGKIFHIYKFRTMTDARDENGVLLPDSERLTKFGVWLRSSSLDELPQLFNILRGEMSFIGPRPQLAEFLSDYTESEKLRHTVRPGLTGLAQVSGRNALPWKKRFELDAEYARRVTLASDLKILLLTVKALLSGGGEIAGDVEDFYDREK